MAIKLAFLDIDGVLSVPIYMDGEKEVLGFSDEGWIEYCVNMGEDSYSFSKPVPALVDYSNKLKESGARLFALSRVQTSFEIAAKKKFLKRFYGDIFEDVIVVSADDLKLQVILAMARKYGVKNEECELVEDTFSTLLGIIGTGVKATHVSAVCSEYENRLITKED